MLYKKVLGSSIIVLTIVSIFGNCHMIWTLIRKQQLQGKTGFIMGATALLHMLTQLCFFGNLFYMEEGTVAQCYPLASVFIVVAYTLTISVMVAAWDLFFNLVVPLRYSLTPTYQLLIFYSVIILIGFSTSVWFSVQGYLTMETDRLITLCNPSLAMNRNLSEWFAFAMNYTNLCTFVVSLIAIVLFYARRQTTVQKKIIRNTLIMVVFFVCTFMIGNIFLTYAVTSQTLTTSERQISRVIGFILIMMAHGSDYYLCIWRSCEYRQAFIEQMKILFCLSLKISNDSLGASLGARITAPKVQAWSSNS